MAIVIFIAMIVTTILNFGGGRKDQELLDRHKQIFLDLSLIFDKQTTYQRRMKLLIDKFGVHHRAIGYMLAQLLPYMSPEGKAQIQEAVSKYDEVVHEYNETYDLFVATVDEAIEVLRR